jgi:hypothetical protein
MGRAGWCAAALLSALWLAEPARAIVCANRDEMSNPSDGWVGNWNGSSGVAISNHWLITAKHVGGGVNGIFALRGLAYRAVEIVQHPTMDVQLVRVAEELPGYHHLADTDEVDAGLPCVLGGWGVTAGDALPDGGWAWNGQRKETWGANMIDGAGALLSLQFDDPASPTGVPHEALFAVNDSGGGLFVFGPTGEMKLAGIAVSVTGWGSTKYGNAAFALNVAEMHNWIMPYVDPSKPLTSSVEAPRALLGGWLVGSIALTAIASRVVRRRRS